MHDSPQRPANPQNKVRNERLAVPGRTRNVEQPDTHGRNKVVVPRRTRCLCPSEHDACAPRNTMLVPRRTSTVFNPTGKSTNLPSQFSVRSAKGHKKTTKTSRLGGPKEKLLKSNLFNLQNSRLMDGVAVDRYQIGTSAQAAQIDRQALTVGIKTVRIKGTARQVGNRYRQ